MLHKLVQIFGPSDRSAMQNIVTCVTALIMYLGVKLDLSQPIPTGPGDAASRYYRPKPLRLGGASTMGFLTKSYGDPQMEGNPQNAGRIACLGMNPIAGVFLPPRAVFIRVGPKPIGTPIRSYCTIADQFSRFLREPPCFEPILPKSYRRTAV